MHATLANATQHQLRLAHISHGVCALTGYIDVEQWQIASSKATMLQASDLIKWKASSPMLHWSWFIASAYSCAYHLVDVKYGPPASSIACTLYSTDNEFGYHVSPLCSTKHLADVVRRGGFIGCGLLNTQSMLSMDCPIDHFLHTLLSHRRVWTTASLLAFTQL